MIIWEPLCALLRVHYCSIYDEKLKKLADTVEWLTVIWCTEQERRLLTASLHNYWPRWMVSTRPRTSSSLVLPTGDDFSTYLLNHHRRHLSGLIACSYIMRTAAPAHKMLGSLWPLDATYDRKLWQMPRIMWIYNIYCANVKNSAVALIWHSVALSRR